MPKPRRSIVACGAAGLIIAVLIAWWWLAPEPAGPNPAEPEGAPTTDELRELVDLSRRAVAHLENEDTVRAIPLLESIGDRVPEDPFAPRNLSIARLLQVELQPEGVDTVAELARRDLEAYAELDSGPLPLRLSARLASATGDGDAAVKALDRAVELSPNDASLHFEFWLQLRDARDEEDRSRALEALVAARAAAPDNVYVLIDLLNEFALREEPRFAETVEQATDLLRPFAAGIENRTTADVVDLLEKAANAAKGDAWGEARRNVRIVANVVRPEAVSQSDRLRVDRSLLEFVALDFERPFYEQPNWKPPEPPKAIAVSFPSRPLDAEFARPVVDLLLRDVDLDGTTDLILLDDEALTILKRSEGRYESLAALPTTGRLGVLAADLDTDVPAPVLPAVVPQDATDDGDATTAEPETCHVADLDFVLWGPAGLLVVENRLADDGVTRRLVPVDEQPALAEVRDVTAAVLVDFDHEGDLDLLVGTTNGIEPFANRGDLVFERLREPLGPPGATSLLSVDVDGDLDLDVVVTAGDDRGGWLENLRHGEMRWRADVSVSAGTAVEVIDTDDGTWSLLVVDGDGVFTRRLVHAAGAPLLAESEMVDGSDADSALVFDFDNDGELDVAAFGTEGLHVTRMLDGVAAGKPREVVPDGVTACDVADVDEDGDLDLVVALSDGRLQLVENDGGNEHHWLRIGLRAQQIRGPEETASGRVNQYGIGSLLESRVGATDLRFVVRRPWTHIGLGRAERASAVRVSWTNGIPYNVVGPDADQLVCERQVLKGSCPYLYTWDGERFRFVTDLLWGSPIGLQFADGVLAPARPWEHLLVPGEALVPLDDGYELRITEELWEVGYFDHVQLVAVDHPAGSSVFTNEKVGGPDVAEPRLHTVTHPRTPVAVRDSAGRDLLPTVRHRDEAYARAFQTKWRQGLVDDHFLEIDLGPAAQEARQLTLFLAGWLQPSDTSLNVAISHDPRLRSPQPPSLQVVGEDGEWQTAIPYTGFPGGKTKTIALDLTGVFPGEDRRLRLATNMEFHWDHVFFTADEPEVELRRTTLELESAELRHRGFSRETLPSGLGPHRYDYEDVSTEPRWPAIRGGFTKYGNVRELVAEEDDRVIVMGAGDEMVLRFAVPVEPLPPGWKRDFVITNVGWDKDADLNTALGQTVEPLPFRAMPRYPYGADTEYPSAEMLQRDRERYHVRRQTWRRDFGAR